MRSRDLQGVNASREGCRVSGGYMKGASRKGSR